MGIFRLPHVAFSMFSFDWLVLILDCAWESVGRQHCALKLSKVIQKVSKTIEVRSIWNRLFLRVVLDLPNKRYHVIFIQSKSNVIPTIEWFQIFLSMCGFHNPIWITQKIVDKWSGPHIAVRPLRLALYHHLAIDTRPSFLKWTKKSHAKSPGSLIFSGIIKKNSFRDSF